MISPTSSEKSLLFLRWLSFEAGGTPKLDEQIARLEAMVRAADLSSHKVREHRAKMLAERKVGRSAGKEVEDVTFTNGNTARACRISSYSPAVVVIWSIEAGRLAVPMRQLPAEIQARFPDDPDERIKKFLPFIPEVTKAAAAMVAEAQEMGVEHNLLMQEVAGHVLAGWEDKDDGEEPLL